MRRTHEEAADKRSKEFTAKLMARPRLECVVIEAAAAEQLAQLSMVRAQASLAQADKEFRIYLAEWMDSLQDLFDLLCEPDVELEGELRTKVMQFEDRLENWEGDETELEWADNNGVAATIYAIEAYVLDSGKAESAIDRYMDEHDPGKGQGVEARDRRAIALIYRLDGLFASLDVLQKDGVSAESIMKVRDVMRRHEIAALRQCE
jgi:hypothetical protein